MPLTLEGWHINAVQEIVAQGVFESDDFDLKEKLPSPKDKEAKQKLVCTCASFANSNGGFLIYEVKDDKFLSVNDRICGIDSNYDFPEHFGNFPAKCSPTIPWSFKNPPLKTESNRSVHIVHIPRSWKAPHAVDAEDGKWLFPKRTNKGSEWMDIGEVRTMFLSFYEKRIRLQLLKSELSELKIAASQIANVDIANDGSVHSTVTFDLSIINSVLAETYVLLSENQELLTNLNNLRFHVRTINNEIELFFRKVSLPLDNIAGLTVQHNQKMKNKCAYVFERCNSALLSSEKILLVTS